MTGLRFAVTPLRVLLVLTFAGLLLLQVFSFPGTFAYWASESETFATVRWPVLAATEVGMLCVQVVIVCTWHLLTLVRQDRVFTSASIRWVDAIIGALGVGWLMLATLVAIVAITADDPGNPLAATLVLLPASTFALVMVVMRALLLQATSLRTDMDAVI